MRLEHLLSGGPRGPRGHARRHFHGGAQSPETHIDIMTGETGAAAEAARPEKRRRQGRTEDALAPRGDEGRDKRRNSPARRKQPLTRGCPNGGTPPRGDTERWANAVN